MHKCTDLRSRSRKYEGSDPEVAEALRQAEAEAARGRFGARSFPAGLAKGRAGSERQNRPIARSAYGTTVCHKAMPGQRRRAMLIAAAVPGSVTFWKLELGLGMVAVWGPSLRLQS